MMDVIVDDDLDATLQSHIVAQDWIQKALQTSFDILQHPHVDVDVCIRFASDKTVQTLNATWRDKDAVTDVLSFPMQEADALNFDESLGDMILALPFVLQEAARLELPDDAHQLHLIVHSLLHLLGYDHIEDDDAIIMQRLECRIMQALDLHHPYPDITLSSCF